MPRDKRMKRYIAEGIGTFFLMFSTVMATNIGDIAIMAPLIIGLTLAAMIYASEHISGAHFNPAVTLAMLMRGKLARNEAFYYPVAQLAGALLAAILGGFLLRAGYATDTQMHVHKNSISSLLAEFTGTFGWVYVMLNVTTVKSGSGNSHFGLAVGCVVAAMIYVLGGISGGVFNPAVALGSIMTGMSNPGDILIFLAGNLIGAAAAATAFQLVHDHEE